MLANGLCGVLILVLVQGAHSTLFPYGVEHGDIMAPGGDDEYFGPTTINTPIVFFERTMTTFYVSTNGLVSFRDGFDSNHAEDFSGMFEHPVAIVAPLWKNLSTEDFGSIFYRSSNSSDMLDGMAELIVNSSSNYTAFRPKLSVVATWQDIPVLDMDYPASRHTFQVVIVTDGQISFAAFIYENVTTLTSIQVGFNAGDGSRWSNIATDSLSAVNVFRIDGKCTTVLIPGQEEMIVDVQACGLSDFLPFGDIHGDSSVTSGLDQSSGPNLIDTPVIFFGRNETSYYVSSSGIITFQSRHRLYFTSVFRFSSSFFFDAPVIAPLWSIYNSGGEIFFRTSNDSALIDRMVEVITNSNSNYSSYRPKLVIVGTWNQTPILLSGGILPSEGSNLQPTFQVAIATDGHASFAAFTYENISSALLAYERQVGFISERNTEKRRWSNIPYDSLSAVNVYRIDGKCTTALVPGQQEAIVDVEACDYLDIVGTAIFPYGEEYGDASVTFESQQSGPMVTDVPIVFYQNSETVIYIFDEGLITFQSPFSSYGTGPQPFSQDFIQSNDPMLAPLWATLLSLSGPNSHVFYRSSNDSDILDRVVEEITALNSNFSTFVPELAVIVTWHNVSIQYGRYTFQAVITTDGRASFAAYLYEDVIAVRHITERPNYVGFNAGDRRRWSNIAKDSLRLMNLYRIDGNCITTLVPGEVCPLNSETFECDGDQRRAYGCVCDDGVTSPLCLDLLPFGKRLGDRQIPPAIDRSEGPLNLSTPMIFYQNREYSLYISTNGLVSFRAPFSSYLVSSFPSVSIPVVAPLWADYDFRKLGAVFYRVSSNESTLNRVRDIIMDSNPNFSAFSPTLCVVVTWLDATPLLRDIQLSFQLILATDGEASFATFIYRDLAVISRLISEATTSIGFSGGQNRGLSVLSNSSSLLSINSFRIDGNCITTTSSADVCGLNSTSLECINLTALSCLCQPEATNTSKCQLTGFFPFGVGNGDEVGPLESDASTSVIHLDDPIAFFLRNQTDLYVSTNGFITFMEEFVDNSFLVEVFPRKGHPLLPFIAPLWTDIIFREGGALYYRVTKERSLLDSVAGRIVQQNVLFDGYQPTLALVATWFQGSLSGVKATFQAVVATDGLRSFSLFNYDNIEEIFSLASWESGFDEGNVDISFSAFLYYKGDGFPESEVFFRIDGICPVPVSSLECGLNSFPAPCDYFRPSSCVCNRGYRPTPTDSCLEFVQFGPRVGDMKIRTNSDSLDPITLPTPVVFNGMQMETLKVEVVLDMQHYYYIGSVKLGSLSGFADLSLIKVPLDKPEYLHHRIDVEEDTLSEVADLILRHNSKLAAFKPVMTVVYTWDVDLFYERINQNNLVQTIIATDGNVSFVIVLMGPRLLSYQNIVIEIGRQSSQTQKENFFRIDGAGYYLVPSLALALVRVVTSINHLPVEINAEAPNNENYGDCVTLALSGYVCGLNSVAVECDDSLNATRCSCNEGYVAVDAVTCEDADECVNDTVCDSNASCTNTNGSYLCICDEGYIGNGLICEDIHECLLDMVCDGNADCTNTNGSFTCTCDDGFLGDGFNCTDIDECEGVSGCDQNSRCMNTDGTYSCTCNEGYQGDGFNCTDIDECEQNLICDSSAICNNTEGSYTCACGQGFRGDNICTDIDECEMDNDCDLSARCINIEGSYLCTCNDGFRGDGLNCTLIEFGTEASSVDVVGLSVGITVAAIAVLVVTCIFLSLLYVCRRVKSESELGEGEYGHTKFKQFLVQSSFKHNLPKSLIVHSSNLKLGSALGQGEFGIVYKGQLKSGFTDTVGKTVAVKTLKAGLLSGTD